MTLSERKKMRISLIAKLFLFSIFIILPILLLQELFVFTYIVPSLGQPVFILLTDYFINHYMVYSYGVTTISICVGIIVFLMPFIQYIMTGEKLSVVKKKIDNPIEILLYFMLILNIGNIINLCLDYNYIFSFPRHTLINFFIFKFVWQILCSLLMMFYFYHISTNIRTTLGLYTFPTDKLSIFSRFKTVGIIVLQFVFFSINIIEISFLLQDNVSKIHYILSWGGCLIVGVLALVNLLFVIQNNIDTKIKERLFTDVKDLTNNGNLTHQQTYYERNMLGSLISEFNVFISDLKNGFQQIDKSTKLLNKETSLLKNNTHNLISTISEQELNVSQMNIATNTTSATVQYLLAEVDVQSNILTKEQHNIDNLISGTQSIVEIFQDITREHQLSQEANQKALSAVEKSLVKTELMNQQINSIHQKIYTAGLETSAIDEVLGIIKNISEQTNLLSMTAAIEAAHGDTSRKGFALVADEIRKLAQMSQESASKVEVRLSAITEHITNAYNISKESVDLASSSLRTGEQLKTTLSQIHETSIELQSITKQADPITQEQNRLITQFQNVIYNMKEFLQDLIIELKKDSTAAVMMSLNFRTMIQNFKKSRTALYYMESNLEQLNLIENHLKSIVQEFNFSETSNKE